MFKDLEEAKKKHLKKGLIWRGFLSIKNQKTYNSTKITIESKLLDGKYFITSEKYFHTNKRIFWRIAKIESHDMLVIGLRGRAYSDSQKFDSFKSAKLALAMYIFEGEKDV